MTDPLAVRVESAGATLAGEQRGGGGVPVVLLHGLTATRRYVVMGSRALERSGHRVIAYDARGHGASAPAPSGDYGYEHLASDLLAVLDATSTVRATLAGVSMGAHTALRFALEHPERVAALALITPAFDPARETSEEELASWDRLAEGLREGGVEGFVDAYDLAALPESWRETVERVLRQRMAAHLHPLAVAKALEAVPRSRPFAELSELAALQVPVAVIASRDEADPGHPLSVGEAYARAIPGARLHVEEAGSPARSPLAWQGGRVSAIVAALTAHAPADIRA